MNIARFILRANFRFVSVIPNRSVFFGRPDRFFQPKIVPKQIKFFASDAGLKNIFKKSQVSRISTYEPRANELITAVRSHDYRTAVTLVKDENVNVNGHDSGENTPLTDAAKRGDASAAEFLITVLHANPNASCDCPDHYTALHYASKNGHTDCVRVLLELGANSSVKSSSGYMPLDIAKTDEIRVMLQSHGSGSLLAFKKQTMLPKKN